jgi:hypothetical protein
MGMLSSHADQQDMSLASEVEPLLHGENQANQGGIGAAMTYRPP